MEEQSGRQRKKKLRSEKGGNKKWEERKTEKERVMNILNAFFSYFPFVSFTILYCVTCP